MPLTFDRHHAADALASLDGPARDTTEALALDAHRRVLNRETRSPEMLGWRVLATMAGATAAGEHVALAMVQDGEQVALRIALPAKLAKAELALNLAAEQKWGVSFDPRGACLDRAEVPKQCAQPPLTSRECASDSVLRAVQGEDPEADGQFEAAGDDGGWEEARRVRSRGPPRADGAAEAAPLQQGGGPARGRADDRGRAAAGVQAEQGGEIRAGRGRRVRPQPPQRPL